MERVLGLWCRRCWGPMLGHVFGTHVVGRVRGPCCGTWSRPMLWDVFGTYVVGGLRDRWGWMCSEPMLRDVFGSHVVGGVQGPYCGTFWRPMIRDVFGAYVVRHVRGSWCQAPQPIDSRREKERRASVVEGILSIGARTSSLYYPDRAKRKHHNKLKQEKIL